ncbi:isochorismatase family protein [Alcaligenes sp. Marseille-Q7550]
MTIHALPSYPLPEAPVANRVDWRPQAQRAALLIHDMQAYFLRKYDMDQAPIPALIERIAALRALCRELGIPVFYTAQPVEQPAQDRALLNDFWGPGLTNPQFHEQQAVIPELAPAEDDIMLTKWRYSAFQRSNLRQHLAELGRDQLIITGVYAHIGCMTTALEAFMQDIQPFLAIDGVADFSLEEHEMAVRHVSQRCGVSLTCAQIQDSLNA